MTRADASRLPPPPALGDAALFLDVDGTLVDFAPTPGGVTVAPGLIDHIERLQAKHGAVAFVSGRPIAQIDSLFAPLRLPAAGIHGLERRRADGTVLRNDPSDTLASLKAPLATLAETYEGVLLEDKGLTLAVHYRLAPDRGPFVRETVGALVAPLAAELRVLDGNMVVEIKPRSADKGKAVAAFMTESPFAGRTAFYLGDDVTDEDAFAAVNALDGVSVLVGPPRATKARWRLESVAAVHAWIAAQ
jgi:trehalose 6-phosphate phosphatase